jgi:class 3 adenylate cyclase/tetratricopeptide (TPR) repeat protein
MAERTQLEQAIVAIEAQRAILGDAAVDTVLESLRRQLADLDNAESQRQPITASSASERRIVTILFCDVTGSTALAESMDPEAWTEIMNAIFEHLIEPVERYQGTVARLMGDAILALFGAPIAHEDDPQRAVLAGLAILENIRPFRKKLQNEQNLDFNVRVGINTGLAVVGDVGSDAAAEYTAMGDAVNLAARMEQTAKPGTVQIAETTYRLVAPLFKFAALGGIEVKGKAERVQSYQVVRRKATPGRLRGIKGLESPLIGREQEFERLTTAVNGLQRGGGGIICLVGEAGLGKSRLIQELKSAIESQPYPLQWHETLSQSYETEQPYALFQRLIRRMVGAKADDSPALLREKFKVFSSTQFHVDALPVEEQEGMNQVFESLFGLKSEKDKPPLEGEAFRGRLYTMMTHLWRYQAERRPVVLVADDLHWTDPASVALLKHLMPLCDQVPLLLLFVLRPDRETPGWELRQAAEEDYPHRYSEIALQPLSHERSGLLVDSLLQISDLPKRLRERILERSEGNPFFVEEVVRSLIDQGVVGRDESGGRWQATSEGQNIDIPDNLLALLVARIDRLAEDARRTLQMASVVGRSFYYRVLARIVELAEELDGQLLSLQQADMIREAVRMPELEYIFRHALTQEAAYSTILLRQRRVFHRQVGEALEALFPSRTDELAGELAEHFYQARDYESALKYYTVAGNWALRLHASAEAIAHYTGAIACTKQVKATHEQLVHLYLRRGRAFELDNQFDKALSNYQELLDLASERGDESLKLASLAAQCIVRATMTPLYDPALAKELGQQALALVSELNDREAEAKVLWGMLLVEHWGGGDNRKALGYGQRSLAICRELGLKEQMGYTLTNLQNVYSALQELGAAREAGREAREIWSQLGNTPMLADVYNGGMWIEMAAGEFDDALTMGREGQRLGQSIGSLWGYAGASSSMAVVYLEQGDIGRAIGSLSEVSRLAKEADVLSIVYFGLPYLVLAYLTAGAFERADRFANQLYAERDSLVHLFRRMSLAVSAEVKIRTGQLELAQRILAEAYEGLDLEGPLSDMTRLLLADAYLQLALENPQLGLERMEYLISRMRQAGMRHYLPEGLWLQGKALLALNEPESGRTAFLEAQKVGEQTGARRILWRILWELSQLEREAGNPTEAGLHRHQAQEIVTYIADHAGSEELRASFLSLPEVQSVLAK